MVALVPVAAERAQALLGAAVFDPLGHGTQAQAVAHLDDRPHDRFMPRLIGEAGHELGIDANEGDERAERCAEGEIVAQYAEQDPPRGAE